MLGPGRSLRGTPKRRTAGLVVLEGQASQQGDFRSEHES